MNKTNSYLAIITSMGLVFGCGVTMSRSAIAQVEVHQLEEVVVTAQKREQALSDIPMSITVLPGNMLEQQQAFDFQDLTSLIPGFSVTGSTPGVTRITLRGVNTGGVASTVGVYYGEVPFGSSSGLANGAILSGDFDTFDLARIEVLRGPQGTLYGASSLGGVLKYIPNEPSTEAFEGRFKAGLETVKHGGLGYAFTGVVNAPLSDTFAIRASGFYRYDDGFIDSIGIDPIPSLTDPTVNIIDGTIVENNLNSSETYGGRFSALWTPTDNFSLNLSAMLQDINSDAPNVVDADAVTLEPLNNGLVQRRYQDSWTDISYQVYSATMDWDFGPASLQSITSWGDFKQDFQVDAALGIGLTGGPPLSSLISFLFGTPLSAILPQTTSTDKFTQELRLISPDNDKFEWLLGAYYTDEDSLISQEIFAVEANTEVIAAGLPALAVVSLTSNYQELAFFGNATWYITDRFDLSFGARASSNDQDVVQQGDGPLAGGPTEFTAESSESPFTWSVSPHYNLTENSSIYARVATGFRPGGPNVLPPGAPPELGSYDSDTLTSYEVGYKMNSDDGRFSVDFTAYYLDWSDIQLFAIVSGYGVNANGGKARSKGAEFAASFAATEALTLSFNGAYTNARLTQDTDPLVGGMNGDALPYVPEWSFGLSADYQWNVMDNSTAYVGGTLGYTGERPTGFENSPSGGYYELDSFANLGLRAGLETGNWAFELYVKNLTDTLGDSDVDAANTLYTGVVELGIIQPLTVGFTVGARF